VSRHRVTIVRDEHTTLFSAEPQYLGVFHAQVETQFQGPLEIDSGLEALGSS